MPTETSNRIRIAIAEDNPDVRRALASLLAALGHTVVGAAADGDELLQLCSLGQVDLVITDLDMPKIDGLAAAEELATRGVPVILLSGHADVAHVRLEHEPVVERIQKPATKETLQAAIELALSSRS